MIRFLILILIFVSCQKDSDGFKIYTVKAGKYMCMKVPKVSLFTHSIQAEFKINETWRKPDRNCWDKILGISEGRHHKNSCRIVHMYVEGKHIIGMYAYANGERISFTIDTVSEGTYYADIGHVGAEWNMYFNGKVHTCRAGKKTDTGYKLYPSIGGNGTINQDWICPINWK